MLQLLKENKKRLLLLMLLCDTFLICCLFDNPARVNVRTASNMNALNLKGEYDQLLINTYLAEIKQASDAFYHEYYTTSPVVNYYSVFMKNIYSDNRTYYVTFTSEPYLGPHDTIGIDEITFSADYHGNIKLERFNHIISYHLPFNLKDLETKPVPGKYENDEQ